MYIKGFDKNLCCRGFKFEIGKTYDTGYADGELELCSNTVFHFCESLQDVNKHYNCAPESRDRFCEVEALGAVVKTSGTLGTNRIKILREITGAELDVLKGLTNGNHNCGDYNDGNHNCGHYNGGNHNCGGYNSGDWNSGDYNSGDWNSGDYNDGNWNSGDYNSGDWNSGDYNDGNWNSGDYNSGDWNSGDYNDGDQNSGDCNNGNWNSGDYNSGDWNCGNKNSGNFNNGRYNGGNWNCGNRNSGDCNNGHCNSGNRNSGNHNKGWHNSGDWNSCNYSSGIFCSKEDQDIRIFNKPSGMSYPEWQESKYCAALNSAPFELTKWIDYTEAEMNTPAKKATCGYLKTYSYKEACANWWAEMSEENKEIIKKIPNFDADIFEEITGIKV